MLKSVKERPITLAEWQVIMFELDQFIADCRAALAADKSHKSVREVVVRAVSHPAAVLKDLGEPKSRWRYRALAVI